MATCEISDKITATLTLDENELRTLADILSRIGGSPVNSLRKYADSIGYAIPDKYRHGKYYGDESAVEYPTRAIYYTSGKMF